MSTSRACILLLFFAIGVFAVSKTLLLKRHVESEGQGIDPGGYRQDREKGGTSGGALRKPWDRLLLVTAALPVFLTAFLLLLYSFREE